MNNWPNNWYSQFNKIAQSRGALQDIIDVQNIFIDSFAETGKIDQKLQQSIVDPVVENSVRELSASVSQWIDDVLSQTNQWTRGDQRDLSVSDLNVTLEHSWANAMRESNTFYINFSSPITNKNRDSLLRISEMTPPGMVEGYSSRESIRTYDFVEFNIRILIKSILTSMMSESINVSGKGVYSAYEKFLEKWIIPNVSTEYYPPNPNKPGEKMRPHGQQTHLWHLVHKQFLPSKIWDLIEKYGFNMTVRGDHSSLSYKSQRTKAPYRYDPRKGTTDFIKFPSMANKWAENKMITDNDKVKLISFIQEAMDIKDE